MIRFITRLFARPLPELSEARPRDAAAISALHGVSFNRGWSEEEVEQLLLDRSVVAHRAMIRGRMAGFIITRLVQGEAEILSVAIAPARRRRGVGRRLLDLHLRRLAGLGARVVFLEVAEDNVAARELYRRFGFNEAARREGYYFGSSGKRSTALVLRCNFP
jgi:[ribosomal protein S18]-alanine N-acetyltransferase